MLGEHYFILIGLKWNWFRCKLFQGTIVTIVHRKLNETDIIACDIC